MHWRGTSIVAIAAVHTLFTLAVANQLGFAAAIRPGVGSADPPDLAGLTFSWSILFGLLLGVLGLVVRDAETRRQPVSRLAGGALLGLCGLGAVLMPVSGFWLAMPAAWSLARHG
jgi:hypothetical protein